jgi:hypothetical protein
MFTPKIYNPGINKTALENLYRREIERINGIIRRSVATYRDWENADERLRTMYKSREEYLARIDYWRDLRHSYIRKLHDLHRGIACE